MEVVECNLMSHMGIYADTQMAPELWQLDQLTHLSTTICIVNSTMLINISCASRFIMAAGAASKGAKLLGYIEIEVQNLAS